jgi:CRP/FNR family cyclic AMP-dependent transcriptional regulator
LTGPVSHTLVRALRAVPDFSALDDHTLLRVVGASVNLFWRAGSTVFESGQPSEALYIVLSGLVRIVEQIDGREVEVSRVGPGNSFGELSLLLRTTHRRTAQAAEDTELLVVPESSFEELLASNADLDAMFRRRLKERLPLRGEVSESA